MADISERMRMEENLRNLNKTKDRIFSIIGHDLRGPIGNILTVMDYFESENAMDEKEKQRMVSIVKRTANSALYLLENLLFWAKMQTGDLSFEVKKINLREMIIPTVALYRVPLSEKKIKIDYHVDPSIMVFGDEQSIKTIIRNMLSNAVKYTPEGGEIRIDVVEALDKVEISVIDSGNGISQENIKKILESSETFSTRGTNGEKGTGLGHRICKEFIEKNGGELKIESEEGIGSRFYFTMKRADILH
jgi:signal transduction histidine kinase